MVQSGYVTGESITTGYRTSGYVYDPELDDYEAEHESTFTRGALAVIPAKYLPPEQRVNGDRIFHFAGSSPDHATLVKNIHELHYGQAQPWELLSTETLACGYPSAILYNLLK